MSTTRADAERNRVRILAAARELIARDGPAVRMDAIAAAAGLAVGTLYRHFPTKDALVTAVVEDSVAAIADLAEGARSRLGEGVEPGTVLDDLVRAVAARHTEDRALKAAAASLGADVHPDLAGLPAQSPAARALAAVQHVLDAAREAGAVRADATVADLLVLLGGLPDADAPQRARERYLDLVLAGLHAHA